MFAALLAAIGIYLLTDAIGQAFIERVYMSAEAQNQRNLATVSSFQTYAREFNLASRCLGTPTGRVITKNLLPQVISVIMMRVALSIPLAIGQEVFLTYIGLGLPISIPSLGNLINEGRIVMMSPSLRYQLIFPSIILSLITISFYVMGNSFADAADPRNHV